MKSQAKKSKFAKVPSKTRRREKASYELPNPLIYRLSDPGYTIYHRAALGGLAATVRAWQDEDNDVDPPAGIAATLTGDTVELSWANGLPTKEVLRRILAASFKRTDEGLIELIGQNIREDQRGLRLAVHDGVMKTFLQSKDSRRAEKKGTPYTIKSPDDDEPQIFMYQPVNSYFHQSADDKMKVVIKDGAARVELMQWLIPGAQKGARALEASTPDAFLLLFLVVASATFLIRPRDPKKNMHSCIVIPDVTDLRAFARSLHNIAGVGRGTERLTDSYLGHIVGGAEEAALRFLIDLKAFDVTREKGVKGCLAITMTKVAWDKKQFNRSMIARLRDNYPELNVFLAANQYLGGHRTHKNRKDETQVWLNNYVPALIAGNLAAEPKRHWCAKFNTLVNNEKDFKQMLAKNVREGLRMIKEEVRDTDDQLIIDIFHKAWNRTMGAMGERAEREGFDASDLFSDRQERMRNEILRIKTSEQLATWFLRFCANATKGGPLPPLRKGEERVRAFIFNPRNFDRFQNLCLFALLTYDKDQFTPKGDQTNGNQLSVWNCSH
ncbi:MAG TPA: type I-MYXAN CRISPR-associated Cas8a1/Cmx1 [Pyrinomonadaceae bacterium]|nr:type I-MYXAN CRISPR-associated Cas8a1/Cmx1 [Pyrinomonadaceae bacterium]